MTKSLGLALVVTMSACGVTQVDPCAGVGGSCLTLRVTGSGDVDALSLHASNAFSGTMTSTFDRGVVALPVRVAIIPKAGASGTLDLEVAGTRGGAFVGAGDTSATLTGMNDRQTLEVHLSKSDVDGSASQDGGADADVPDGGSCPPNEGIACADTMTLRQCNAGGTELVTTKCDIACSTTGTPHCAVLVPHAPITSAVLTSAPQEGIVNLTGTLSINTDTGQIGALRAANTNPATSEVIASVEFHQIDGKTSVFSAQGFAFASGSNVTVLGSRPLVLVATQTIEIDGLVDARPQGTGGHCSGAAVAAGGFAGGSAGTPNGSGPGGGLVGANGEEPVGSGGGGGGGGATVGGMGGKGYYNGMFAAGGTAGAVVTLAYPIIGGSGGGAGSPGGATGTPGRGGGGGGAVQLVAGQSITIVGSQAPVGVLASGCGGTAGAGGGSPGGGGAGGTVLLESPSITLGTYGAVVANGGGGGGGDDAPDQSDLRNGGTGGGGYDAANGMADSGGYGTGGADTGLSPDGYGSTTTNLGGGGGGGGGGYVLLFDLTGMATMQAHAFASPGNSMSLVNGVITYE